MEQKTIRVQQLQPTNHHVHCKKHTWRPLQHWRLLGLRIYLWTQKLC